MWMSPRFGPAALGLEIEDRNPGEAGDSIRRFARVHSRT